MKEKDTEKQLKALEEAVRQEQETGGKTAKKHRESSSAAAKESHPLASFLIGLVLLGAGIFWVLNSFVVSFSPSRHQTATGCDHAEHDHILPQRSRHRTKPHRSQQRYQNCQQSDCRHHPADPLSIQEEQQTDADQQRHQHQTSCQ